MVVERARGETQSVSGSLQSLCWGSSAFGGIVSSYFSGSLVHAYGVRYAQKKKKKNPNQLMWCVNEELLC